MKTKVKLNNKIFIIHIIRQFYTDLKPYFSCEIGEKSVVCETLSVAINYMYKNITYKKGTEYLGHFLMGFDESSIIKELLLDVNFQPFTIFINKISIFISLVSIEWSIKWDSAGKGFCSSFTSKFQTMSSLFVQKISNNNCFIEIYRNDKYVMKYNAITPTGI